MIMVNMKQNIRAITVWKERVLFICPSRFNDTVACPYRSIATEDKLFKIFQYCNSLNPSYS